jgi:hypothetical protein
MDKNEKVLGLDVSTKTIGIALFENMGGHGELLSLNHVSPKIKPKPKTNIAELCEKATIFEAFLAKHKDTGITKVVIEEPLLRSNNVYTVGTLLRFNGMVSRSVYNVLGVAPDFISSYDARAFGFPELMQKRTHKKDGTKHTDAYIKKTKPVLFGGLPYDIDKKEIIWEKVGELEPQIEWLYNKANGLMKENFDMTDAYVAVIGQMRKEGIWL